MKKTVITVIRIIVIVAILGLLTYGGFVGMNRILKQRFKLKCLNCKSRKQSDQRNFDNEPRSTSKLLRMRRNESFKLLRCL